MIARDPKIEIAMLLNSYMSGYNTSLDGIISRPGWSAISAVKNNKIYFIDGDLLVKPGPRLVEDLRN